MNQTYSLLKSRTFWLLVVSSLLPVANAIVPTLPPGAQAAVSSFLGIIAIYTHREGVQNFGAKVAQSKDV